MKIFILTLILASSHLFLCTTAAAKEQQKVDARDCFVHNPAVPQPIMTDDMSRQQKRNLQEAHTKQNNLAYQRYKNERPRFVEAMAKSLYQVTGPKVIHKNKNEMQLTQVEKTTIALAQQALLTATNTMINNVNGAHVIACQANNKFYFYFERVKHQDPKLKTITYDFYGIFNDQTLAYELTVVSN